MDRRVAPPRELEALLDRLTEQPSGVFETKQKALMYAAALGRYLKKRVPVERRGTAIRLDIFENALDDGYLNALAVAETSDLQLLADARTDEKLTIFEEYAHAGLLQIQNRTAGDLLDALLSWTHDAASASNTPQIDPEVLRVLAL